MTLNVVLTETTSLNNKLFQEEMRLYKREFHYKGDVLCEVC